MFHGQRCFTVGGGLVGCGGGVAAARVLPGSSSGLPIWAGSMLYYTGNITAVSGAVGQKTL